MDKQSIAAIALGAVVGVGVTVATIDKIIAITDNIFLEEPARLEPAKFKRGGFGTILFQYPDGRDSNTSVDGIRVNLNYLGVGTSGNIKIEIDGNTYTLNEFKPFEYSPGKVLTPLGFVPHNGKPHGGLNIEFSYLTRE